MRTVYFCTEREFPRGDAGANRILNMAKALQTQGWNTIVLSMGHAKKEHWSEQDKSYLYQGIKYKTLPEYSFGKAGRIYRRISAANKMVAYLKEYGLKNGDVVITYSSTYSFCKTILNYGKKIEGVEIMHDVVEWHQPFQFDTISTRYIYKSFIKAFDEIFPSTGYVIVISECLKQHFESLGCKVLKLPIYITPDDNCASGSKEEGKINLIYPGNPYQKDSLPVMLEALNMLDENEKRNVCFHLTGVKRNFLNICVPDHTDIMENLIQQGVVVVHEWMEYEDLMRLYDSIDFALIARPNNKVTQANFPSKVPELLNRGIPPVITKVGDIAEYINDGEDAIFMQDCTAQDCVAAIRRCLAMSLNEIEKMHFSAKMCARVKFDYILSAKMLSDFIN